LERRNSFFDDDSLVFLFPLILWMSKSFWKSKRKAEEFHECGGNDKPEPEGKGNTMGWDV